MLNYPLPKPAYIIYKEKELYCPNGINFCSEVITQHNHISIEGNKASYFKNTIHTLSFTPLLAFTEAYVALLFECLPTAYPYFLSYDQTSPLIIQALEGQRLEFQSALLIKPPSLQFSAYKWSLTEASFIILDTLTTDCFNTVTTIPKPTTSTCSECVYQNNYFDFYIGTNALEKPLQLRGNLSVILKTDYEIDYSFNSKPLGLIIHEQHLEVTFEPLTKSYSEVLAIIQKNIISSEPYLNEDTVNLKIECKKQGLRLYLSDLKIDMINTIALNNCSNTSRSLSFRSESNLKKSLKFEKIV